MSMTSGSDERMVSGGLDSPSIDDANSGGITMGANGGPLKKGPWTTSEDAILVEYVTKHGEGNWNAVQKHSGLARCGKSCRLRWANHLRPDLKKGAFTPEEEQRIIELHFKMGNKWARMAAELPGRTDNEIKNYWNTRIKRRQRAGLPIYPPEFCPTAIPENQQTDNGINSFSSGDVHTPDFNNLEIPAVEFRNLELNHQIFSQALLDVPNCGLLDIPTSNLLVQGLHPSDPNKSILPTVQPCKRLRGSMSDSYSGINSGFPNGFATGIPYQSDCSLQMAQSVDFTSSAATYDHNSNSNHATCSTLFNGSHAFLNGNPSSEPSWAMKLELPSCQTQLTSWGSPTSQVPILESIDILIQTPTSEHNQSSPQNSGLLDAVLYESGAMMNSKSNCCMQTTSHAPDVYSDIMSNAIHETEWDAYEDEVGHSSSSVFSESTPNSIDELHSAGNFPGCKIKEEPNQLGFLQCDRTMTNQMMFPRPDFLLGSNYFGPNDHSFTFLGDDLSRDCKQEDTGVATSSSQGHGHEWSTMSTA